MEEFGRKVRNFTPFLIVLLRVGQWKDEVNGSKNNSSDCFSLHEN